MKEIIESHWEDTRRKRIAVISDRSYPFFKGGAEKRYWEISKQLTKRGYAVCYFTGQWPEMPKEITVDGINLLGTYRVGKFYKNGKKSIWETIKYTISLIRYLATENYDLIECEQFPILPIYLCKLFSLIRRVPLVVTWHEVWGKELWLNYLGPLGLIGALLELVSVHLPNKIISVSPHTTCRLTNLYKVSSIKIDTIPNGIDLRWDRRDRNRQTSFSKSGYVARNIVEKRVPVEPSDIIYVGRLLDHKNIDVLIRAVEILKVSRPEIKCLIVGDGPERNKLEELVKSLNIEGNVDFIGFINHEKRVYSYMKSSKVFVLPSVREGFGISVLEANACGLPALVIKNDNNAACDLIKNGINGYICEFNARKIAQLVVHIINSPHKRYHDACQNVVQNYGWSEIGTRVEILYKALLNGSSEKAHAISEVR